MTSPAHARLAPSASHRWINCPGSIRMSLGMSEDTETEWAAEGTAAHELAARCLEENVDMIDFAGEAVEVGKFEFHVDDHMIENVQIYVDHVRSIIDGCKGGFDAEFEQKLDMRHVHPDLWGTGDTVIYDAEAEWLHVVDLKYGKGVVVEVDQNPQLFAYGLGAAQRHHNRALKGISLWIVQPRAPHKDGPVRCWDADLLELLEFEEKLKDAAEATDAEDAPLVAGEWCRFCPAFAVCPAARERSAAVAIAEFNDEPKDACEMTPTELAAVLKEANFLQSWIKSVQAYAHEQAVAGRTPPGFKLVPKRAMRKWRDEAAAAEELTVLIGEEDIYVDPKLRSPAQIEKLVGKAQFRGMEEALVEKKSSGTNLVPLNDPREPVKTGGMDEFADA